MSLGEFATLEVVFMRKILTKTLTYIRPIDIVGVFMLIVVIGLYTLYDVPYRTTHWTSVYSIYGGVVGMVFLAALLYQMARVILVQKKDFTYRDFFIFAAARMWAYIKIMIPFIIFMIVYDSLHDITAYVNSNYLDAVLIQIDRWLLLGSDVIVLAYTIIPQFLTQWLVFSYNLYFLYFILTPFIFVLLEKDKEIEEALSTVILGCYIGVVGYFLVPCYGPVIAQRDLFDFSFAKGYLIERYAELKFFYHCFPSLHVAITAIWLYFSKKHIKWLYYIYLPLIVSLWIATLYLRWHYLIDVIAGFIIAWIAIKYGPKMNKKLFKKPAKNEIL